MDEWSDMDGNAVISPEFTSYMTRFADDMDNQFYSKLSKHTIPVENLRFAAGDGLREYVPALNTLLDRKAGVIFSGGVGLTGHIMFWEPTYGSLLGREVSEEIMFLQGASFTTETIAQNRFTSTASAPVPAFANTIGLGMFCLLREYEEKNPGMVNAILGLDNVEEPLIWQRFIAQSMLAMEGTDPTFGATYPATVPGAYIIVENHLQSFHVPAKVPAK